MIRSFVLPLALVSALVVSACDNPNAQNQAGTAVAAGAIGAIAATALGANTAWTVAAAGAAATAGALYARNHQTNECAYHTGNGDDVVIRPC
ncbi:hypothetical protein AB0T83_17175 [Fluviibacterium sp. DFM31]|uniref:Glycine zipper domain-containing protein n=1 Tax=Meridianimarinicoccus marinus TaxID=3231483 RepID=A0ABV3LAB6_9RHOB